jgi:PPOX class probable F420-dependent enzyme
MSTNVTLSDAARAFLEEPRFAVLATIGSDGTPQQTVMWYELRGDQIMMNTTADRVKNANVRRDPRVSVCFEEGYRYVTIWGRVEEIIDDHDIAVNDILSLAARYNPGKSPDDFAYFRDQARQTLLISIDRLVTNGLGD